MKFKLGIHAALAILLSLVCSTGFAGGRYADPPPNLVEVQKNAKQALDALTQGNKEAALAAAQLARKLAAESYKEKSTMPMQNSSSRLKKAIASIQEGKPDEAKSPLEETVKLMSEEIDFYTKEGKL